ncbi:MAG: adaptor protein MecA [Faecalimonas sp.]|nr:adaptor protein MecA [Faecalimonas sp.]
MKIEKLNDNQIRCTLTPADLADRQLKLSELVCGTEKAKSLFQDMIKQASFEFDFEVEDMPLMIEAVPASSGSIVLIITKVDDPEELDSKFSKFGSSWNDSDNKKRTMLDKLEGADDFLDLLQKVKEAVSELPKQLPPTAEKENEEHMPRIRLFSFSTLDHTIHACRLLKMMYHGSNTLYKDAEEGVYILALTQSDHTTAEFNKVCNMLSEYGSAERANGAMLAFLEEHCDVIVADAAIQQLGEI